MDCVVYESQMVSVTLQKPHPVVLAPTLPHFPRWNVTSVCWHCAATEAEGLRIYLSDLGFFVSNPQSWSLPLGQAAQPVSRTGLTVTCDLKELYLAQQALKWVRVVTAPRKLICVPLSTTNLDL